MLALFVKPSAHNRLLQLRAHFAYPKSLFLPLMHSRARWQN
jgi:hypothetical protein